MEPSNDPALFLRQIAVLKVSAREAARQLREAGLHELADQFDDGLLGADVQDHIPDGGPDA